MRPTSDEIGAQKGPALFPEGKERRVFERLLRCSASPPAADGTVSPAKPSGGEVHASPYKAGMRNRNLRFFRCRELHERPRSSRPCLPQGLSRPLGLPHRIKSGPYLWGKERLLRCGEWDASQSSQIQASKQGITYAGLNKRLIFQSSIRPILSFRYSSRNSSPRAGMKTFS